MFEGSDTIITAETARLEDPHGVVSPCLPLGTLDSHEPTRRANPQIPFVILHRPLRAGAAEAVAVGEKHDAAVLHASDASLCGGRPGPSVGSEPDVRRRAEVSRLRMCVKRGRLTRTNVCDAGSEESKPATAIGIGQNRLDVGWPGGRGSLNTGLLQLHAKTLTEQLAGCCRQPCLTLGVSRNRSQGALRRPIDAMESALLLCDES